jgi:hypothetical protein
LAVRILIFRIVLVAVAALAAILLLAAFKPGTIHVQRSILIQAPAAKVLPLIEDFHQWPQWAPQDREDPTIRRSYSGAESGVGAVSDWAGKGSAGKGRMEITEAGPSRVVVQVDWARPMRVRNINDFALRPMGDGTLVVWTMQGPNLYPMKVMGVLLNMDKVMGKHFEAGLTNLKAVAEK